MKLLIKQTKTITETSDVEIDVNFPCYYLQEDSKYVQRFFKFDLNDKEDAYSKFKSVEIVFMMDRPYSVTHYTYTESSLANQINTLKECSEHLFDEKLNEVLNSFYRVI